MTLPASIEDLRNRIISNTESMTPQIIRNIMTNTLGKARCCIKVGGRPIFN